MPVFRENCAASVYEGLRATQILVCRNNRRRLPCQNFSQVAKRGSKTWPWFAPIVTGCCTVAAPVSEWRR